MSINFVIFDHRDSKYVKHFNPSGYFDWTEPNQITEAKKYNAIEVSQMHVNQIVHLQHQNKHVNIEIKTIYGYDRNEKTIHHTK